MDYILFVQKDVTCVPNPNEVMSYKYVDKDELKLLLAQGEKGEVKVTPWFKIICENFMFKWWDNLSDLIPFIDIATVHKMI